MRSRNWRTRGCVLERIAAVVPIATTLPLSISTMRSAIRNALANSCVTTTMVMWKAFFNSRINLSTPAAMIGSSPADGSSKKRNLRVHGHGSSHRGALLHPSAELRRHVVFKSCQSHLIELQSQYDFDG